MKRLSVLAAALVVALGVTGCRGRQAAPVTPPPAASPTAPARTRVGVVDLQAVAKAHPRAKELAALEKQIQQVEGQLAEVPVPPPVSSADIQRALEEEGKRLRAEFDKEIDTMRTESRRQLESFAEDLRKEQEAKFEATRKQVEDDARKAVEAKRDDLRAQLKAAEHDIMEEYRYPLLNLRLRAEVAGLRSEEEGRQVLRQLQALQQEREERIRAKAEEIDRTFQEFQKTTEAEVNATLKALQEQLNAESQKRLDAKEEELRTALTRQAAERDKAFRERMEQRRRQLIAAAESQLRGQQGLFLKDVSERSQRLRAELVALQEQRVRLEDSILAEVKIEIAAIAQAQKLDVVLTRYVANLAGIDITPEVVQKLKR